MKIYTSYFAQLKRLPEDLVKIAICVSPPKYIQTPLRMYPDLAPEWGTVSHYKATGDVERFEYDYCRKVLHRKTPEEYLNDLAVISEGRDCVLLCYEKSTDFCHRILVREYLGAEEWRPEW